MATDLMFELKLVYFEISKTFIKNNLKNSNSKYGIKVLKRFHLQKPNCKIKNKFLIQNTGFKN